MTAMRQVWGETLVTLARTDDRVIVIDGDLGTSTRADLFAAALPDRFLQMGIAEQNLVGVAVGLSLKNFVPWLSSFAVFFTHRALDQIRMLVAQTHANVKIAGSYSGLLTGLTGKSHHDVEDLAIMRAMPGMTVLAPGDEEECRQMMRWATSYHGPVYLRVARDDVPPLPPAPEEFRPGPVRRLRAGSDVTLVSTGVESSRVFQAATVLAEGGIDAAVIHVPCLKPFDAGSLLAALGPAPLVITVEDHNVIGGLGGLVAETLAEAGTGRVLRRVGVEDTWSESAPDHELLDMFGLSPRRVAETVRRHISELAGPGRASASAAASQQD